MLIYEFRVVLPMTVEEYQRAQLYSVAEASKNETGGGDGIEVMSNEPFDTEAPKKKEHVPEKELRADKLYTQGQYTHKIYHLEHKVASFIRMVAPKGSLTVQEKAWNAYPYCRTVITNDYMKEHFFLKIETIHLSDRGETENAHCLNPEELAKRHVVKIDIANDKVRASDYKATEDPTKYKSEKTGRGPLRGPDWKKATEPVMCCYKLVTIYFKWWGIQNRVESYVMKQEQRIFTNFHRQVFCWTDRWYEMTMEDIRRLEDKTKEDLDQIRQQGTLRGTSGDE